MNKLANQLKAELRAKENAEFKMAAEISRLKRIISLLLQILSETKIGVS